MNALIVAALLCCGLVTILSLRKTKARRTTLLARTVSSVVGYRNHGGKY